MNKSIPQVALLAVPESSASTLYGMYDLFMSAGRDWQMIAGADSPASAMQPLVVAAQASPFCAANDVRITPDASLTACSAPDIVCVPDLMVSPHEVADTHHHAEITWLKRCHAQGAIIAAACSGAILLAQAGLLDGQEATTHWAYSDALAARYPRVKLRPQRALVISGEGGRLVMAGGGTSWLDLALYLVARSVGIEEAMQVAKVNLIDWHDIGQQPFARLAHSRQVDDAIIARCQVWIAQHYAEPAPVAAMVRLSGLAERSFKRRFQSATGMAPLEYVHTLRLEEAKHLLETGNDPIEAIALEVGYEDAGFFSRLFRRQVNLTPAQYRKRFGALRRALEPHA